jgi:hypothetical protein
MELQRRRGEGPHSGLEIRIKAEGGATSEGEEKCYASRVRGGQQCQVLK